MRTLRAHYPTVGSGSHFAIRKVPAHDSCMVKPAKIPVAKLSWPPRVSCRPYRNRPYGGVADDISKELRLHKLRRRHPLRDLVIDRLKPHWSPEQIVGRLLADGISAVGIWPENDLPLHLLQGKLRPRLLSASSGRAAQTRSSRIKPRRSFIPFDCRITQRPEFINDRSQFCHQEGDLSLFCRELGEANVASR